MIPFNKAPHTGNEEKYVIEAIKSGQKLSGDGPFSRKCQEWFEQKFKVKKTLLTPSCTHALEMAAILIDTAPGDEIIMPSYTFVSTANAFVLRGANIVFVDVDPKTMNLDANLIESAITENTKAIVPVHYAGVSCDMDEIMELANNHGLYVIEDAAQGMMSTYKDKALGTIGHLGTYSFHETKNYTSGGEGGLLLINDEKFISRAEIIREKGTNRSQFFRGMVDKYSWVDMGSSQLPSELQASYLWGQLESAEEINNCRLKLWNKYFEAFSSLKSAGVELPTIPENREHNAHMFYLKTKNLKQRTDFISCLNKHDIGAAFHYVPLHTSVAGEKFGRFNGEDRFTTKESEKLVRLPMYYGLSEKDQDKVIKVIKSYFE